MKTERTNENIFRNPYFVTALCLTTYIGAFLILFKIVPEAGDDTVIMSILTGAMGRPSAEIIFSNILFGKVLQFLFVSFPGTNWYALAQFFLSLAAFYAAGVMIMKSFHPLTGVFLSFLFYVVMGFDIFSRINFTKVAGLLCAAGLALIIFHDNWRKMTRKSIGSAAAVILGIALTTIGSMIRFDSFLAVGAVFSLYLFFLFVRECRARRVASAVAAVVSLLVMFAAVFGCRMYNTRYYKSDPAWAAYTAYNSARSKVRDYPLAPYEENKERYEKIGVSYNDFLNLSNFNIADPEFYTTARLNLIADLARNPEVFDKNLEALTAEKGIEALNEPLWELYDSAFKERLLSAEDSQKDKGQSDQIESASNASSEDESTETAGKSEGQAYASLRTERASTMRKMESQTEHFESFVEDSDSAGDRSDEMSKDSSKDETQTEESTESVLAENTDAKDAPAEESAGLKQKAKDFLRFLKSYFNFPWIYCFAAFLFLGKGKNKWIAAATAIVMVGAMSLQLFVSGRYNLIRLQYLLWIAAFMVLLSSLKYQDEFEIFFRRNYSAFEDDEKDDTYLDDGAISAKRKSRTYIASRIAAWTCALLASLVCLNMSAHDYKSTRHVNVNRDLQAMFSSFTTDKNNLYFVDSSTTCLGQNLNYMDYYDPSTTENVYMLGGWYTGAKGLNEMLAQKDLLSPMSHLADDNAYLVTRFDPEVQAKYMEEHYGIETEVEEVERFGDFAIYRLKKEAD